MNGKTRLIVVLAGIIITMSGILWTLQSRSVEKNEARIETNAKAISAHREATHLDPETAKEITKFMGEIRAELRSIDRRLERLEDK